MSAHDLDQASVEPRRVHNGGWSTDATDPEMVRALARRVIRPLRERARELGWAIGMHGSLERDIDLIAVPWTERAAPPDALVKSVRQVLEKLYGVGLEVGPNEAHPKPHGRLCWSFWIRPWTYIDLSIWPAGAPDLTDALKEIAAERRRQIEAEGWTPDHDDAHGDGALAAAAACYAIKASLPVNDLRFGPASPPPYWPGWANRWWKPKDRRADLIRAGALIVAEIERLDRAAPGAADPIVKP